MRTLETSTPPAAADGRNVDPRLGALSGEGWQQRVTHRAQPLPAGHELSDVPADAVRTDEGPSYYGAPLLKEPVWRWYIPAYFYAGGVAGAAAALGAAAQLALRRGSPGLLRRVAPAGEDLLLRRCRLIATSGAAASAVLLVADLGRPGRFLNMLRVFRPTSPMNMGTWILSAFGASAAASTAAHLLPLPAGLRRAGEGAALAAGVMGLPLCTYTGVLIANTAVPIWQGTRRSLPVLFAASGAAGAASLLELWPPGGRGDAVVHRFAVIGKALEVALSEALAREAGAVPRVGRPLRHGASAALWRASQALSLAGLAASVASGLGAPTRRVAGLLGTLGALSLRFAVMAAGRASARDPHATSAQQRAGRGARDVVREEAQAGASLPVTGAEAGLGTEYEERGHRA